MGTRRCKDGWFKTYLELTKNTESPLQYHIWSAVAAISGAMSRNTYFDMRLWKIYPNLYIVLVGPTGVKKSTASRTAVRLYRKALPDSERHFIIEGKITGPRLCTDLSNQYLLNGQARAFIHAPEFTVFTNSTMSEDTILADMMNYWDCPDNYEYRLKTGGVLTINNVYVTLLGCSTVETLETAGKTSFIDSGFSSRIIYVNAEENSRRIYRPALNEYQQQLEDDLCHDLQEISRLSGEYVWDESADTWQQVWYESSDWRLVSDKRMLGYVERKQANLIKLTMIIKAAFGDDNVITEKENVYALRMLEGIEPGASRVYQRIGTSKYSKLVQRIIDALSHHSEGLTESALYKVLCRGYPKKDIMLAIETLISASVVTVEERRMGFNNSRVVRRYCLTNPVKGEHHETENAGRSGVRKNAQNEATAAV